MSDHGTMTKDPAARSWIGQPVRRVEDARLVMDGGPARLVLTGLARAGEIASFTGISDPEQRANIIAYLMQFSTE